MEFLRTMQFAFTGYRHFTKWSKPLPPLEGNLEGKNYVITGSNSGIGYEAAKDAAKRKAIVFLVCRNQQRGNKAIKSIQQQTGNKNVHLILGQIGTKKQMDSIYKQLKDKVKKIDILVHNAGCMIHQLQYTEDKIQKNFAANTFGVFYLTNLCLDLLYEQSRVITVSSGGMLTKPLELKDPYMEKQKFDGTAQYARNKRQQVCMMEYYAQKYPSKGKFVSMHPGWVDTDAVRVAMPDFYKKMKDSLKPAAEGADTINYLSLVQFSKLKNGEFYFDRQVADKHLTISRTNYEGQEINKMIQMLEQLSK